MIKSFANKELELFWQSQGQMYVKCVPPDLRRIIYRKLRELNNVRDSRDLRAVPGNHFEKLKGTKHFGYHSIRINRQYRLLFIWKSNQVYEVDINKHDKNY